jgi:hypothetical protein
MSDLEELIPQLQVQLARLSGQPQEAGDADANQFGEAVANILYDADGTWDGRQAPGARNMSAGRASGQGGTDISDRLSRLERTSGRLAELIDRSNQAGGPQAEAIDLLGKRFNALLEKVESIGLRQECSQVLYLSEYRARIVEMIQQRDTEAFQKFVDAKIINKTNVDDPIQGEKTRMLHLALRNYAVGIARILIQDIVVECDDGIADDNGCDFDTCATIGAAYAAIANDSEALVGLWGLDTPSGADVWHSGAFKLDHFPGDDPDDGPVNIPCLAMRNGSRNVILALQRPPINCEFESYENDNDADGNNPFQCMLAHLMDRVTADGDWNGAAEWFIGTRLLDRNKVDLAFNWRRPIASGAAPLIETALLHEAVVAENPAFVRFLKSRLGADSTVRISGTLPADVATSKLREVSRAKGEEAEKRLAGINAILDYLDGKFGDGDRQLGIQPDAENERPLF